MRQLSFKFVGIMSTGTHAVDLNLNFRLCIAASKIVDLGCLPKFAILEYNIMFRAISRLHCAFSESGIVYQFRDCTRYLHNLEIA